MEALVNRLVTLTANTPAAEFHGPPQFLANTDANQVNSRFARADAREFYTQHNPAEVLVESIWDDITFYPFADLDNQQVGYATDGRTGETDPEWPANMLVIADCAANPIMLDPAADGEVFFAVHGMGSWDPQPIAQDIAGLMKLSIAWLEMSAQRGDDLYDDTDDIHPVSMDLFRELAAAQGVDDRYIENVIALR